MTYNKFRAVKEECDHGHLHDSKSESRRCVDLHALQAVGVISGLTQQPSFPVEINGALVCRYVADFGYQMVDSGLAIVEDVKGVRTRIFQLKKKLVEASHPGVVITVYPPVKRKTRKSVKK
jgi:hypothetical protein